MPASPLGSHRQYRGLVVRGLGLGDKDSMLGGYCLLVVHMIYIVVFDGLRLEVYSWGIRPEVGV